MGNEKENFDAVILYASHFCSLYELLCCDQRVKLTQEAEDSVKKYFKIKEPDSLLQIGGMTKGDQQSLLLIRNPSNGMTTHEFEHEYTSQLLRSAIVFSVAALDKYMHSVVVNRCFTLLSSNKTDTPERLRELKMPVTVAFDTVNELRKNWKSRPGYIIKEKIRDELHAKTMQGSRQIDIALGLMGVKGFWKDVAAGMNGSLTDKDIKTKLDKIVQRRNQITHEADILRTIRSGKVNFRKISKSDTTNAVAFIMEFVAVANTIFYPNI